MSATTPGSSATSLSASQRWTARYAESVMNTFGTPQKILVSGQGTHVQDADGKDYTDLLAGIAVSCLGHAHPAVLNAVTEQLSTLGHVSNFFATPAQITLAEELGALVFPSAPAGSSKVFLSSSGAEANEAAFKIARRHGGGARPRVLALEGSFHGRTMGALALTHKAAYREPFEPLPGGVEFLPAGDVAALRAAMGADVAALVVEPVQGEAGVRELPQGYLEVAREVTEQAGALLIIDEVQTGMGRTGAWMAHHLLAPGLSPDVVTLAKGLGGGVPVGATVATGQAAQLLTPGQHGTTFGGNPVACAAALAVIATIRQDDLLARVTELGDRWAQELAAVPGVAQVRGCGLLRGIGLEASCAPAPQVAAALMDRGFIVNAPRPDTIRLAPAFILSDDDAQAFTAVLADVLAQTRPDPTRTRQEPYEHEPASRSVNCDHSVLCHDLSTSDQGGAPRAHQPDPEQGAHPVPG